MYRKATSLYMNMSWEMCESQLVHISVWSCWIACVMRFEKRKLALFCWPDWIDKGPLRTNSTPHIPTKQKTLLRTDDEVTRPLLSL